MRRQVIEPSVTLLMRRSGNLTILDRFAFICHVDEKDFVSGRGHRKSREQRYYEKPNYEAGKNSVEVFCFRQDASKLLLN